jgi:proteic killer suppression protein
MIRSFRDPDTERIFTRQGSRRLSTEIQRIALRKLALLHGAGTLEDLRIPPGNRLEKLRGDRVGQYSIRINDRYRICFEWRSGDAYQVEIVDYH